MENSENLDGTTEIREGQKIKGRPGIEKIGKKFSKEYQPTLAARKRKYIKKKLLEDLLALQYTGTKDGKVLDMMAEYFDVPREAITIEMMMDFRQIEKSIAKSDTKAYTAVKEFVYGKPKQSTDITTKGKAITTNKTPVINIHAYQPDIPIDETEDDDPEELTT